MGSRPSSTFQRRRGPPGRALPSCDRASAASRGLWSVRKKSAVRPQESNGDQRMPTVKPQVTGPVAGVCAGHGGARPGLTNRGSLVRTQLRPPARPRRGASFGRGGGRSAGKTGGAPCRPQSVRLSAKWLTAMARSLRSSGALGTVWTAASPQKESHAPSYDSRHARRLRSSDWVAGDNDRPLWPARQRGAEPRSVAA